MSENQNNLVLIAALAKNNVIGNEGKVPWHISEDLQRFKKLTIGYCLIMGRKTYESLDKPLENRKIIVISKSGFDSKNAEICNSLENAVLRARSYDKEDIYVGGGGEIYSQTISLASRLEITYVGLEVKGDTKFPDIDTKIWKLDWREVHLYKNLVFATYSRRK
ncbi:dihydrofolate reductase [Candidatus Pacearchaeota archaeon]|nr:dihydrofolate reductase [Candidatus Pacearchaeota archaeon]